jgi:hypothetical protein
MTAVEKIEEDIEALRAELQFCRKEVVVLSSEQETCANVAVAQTADIDRYLHKEIRILDDMILKQD